MPCSLVPAKYRNICLTAVICCKLGFAVYDTSLFTVMRLSVAGREQQKNTNYAFRALRAVQLLSQVCGITATQLYEARAVRAVA